MSDMRVRPGVKLLVERDGEILVLRADMGDAEYWILPGGKVEYGESPTEALKREIREELGREASIGEPIGVYHYFSGADGDGQQIVITVFDGEIDSGAIDIDSPTGDDYIVEYRWIEPERLARETGTASFASFLREYADAGG